MVKEIRPVIRPFAKQHKAWEAMKSTDPAKYIVYGGGAGGGKTWFGCENLLTSCYFYPGFRAFVGRNELKRLMGSVYITWQKVCSLHQIPKADWKFNGGYNYIEFTNGSRIDFLDVAYQPSDPLYERFGSLEYSQGWLEEAGEIDFVAFDVLKTRIGRHLNSELNIPPKILITCNPKKNWLYQMVYKPSKEGTLSKEFKFIPALYSDNPHTREIYGQQLESITDIALKQRLQFGNWEYEDDPNTLINYDAINDLFTNTIDASEEQYITADIARYGRDKTVLAYWKGLECYEIQTFAKQGIDTTAEIIKLEAKERKVPYSHILVDSDGVGGGVEDILRGIKGFVANTKTIDNKVTGKPDNFQNLKTQCIYLLADYINNHKIAIKGVDQKIRTEIVQELEQIKSLDPELDGKRKLVPKDVIKELIGRSPDVTDAITMRMLFELSPVINSQVATRVWDYEIPADSYGEYGLN